MRRFILLLIIFPVLPVVSFPLDVNAGMAEYYYDYLPKILSEKGAEPAEQFLLRAQDFADYSSDLSFELARIEITLERPRRLILAFLDRALTTNRWQHSSALDAHLYKALILNELMEYNEAIIELEHVPDSPQKEVLILGALLGMRYDVQFCLRIKSALAKYPYNEDIITLLYKYAVKIDNPSETDSELIDAVTERIITSENQNLVRIAAPFMYDEEKAHWFLSAWYARCNPAIPRDSLPALMNLGVIDEDAAIDHLFVPGLQMPEPFINRKTLISVFNLLRTESTRTYFINKLASFTGAIAEDRNNDGIYESFALYNNGMIVLYINDNAQERIDRVIVHFTANALVNIEVAQNGNIDFLGRAYRLPQYYNVEYDGYPAVRTISLGDVHYQFIPRDFYYEPVMLRPVFDGAPLIFPEFSFEESNLNERTLFSFSYSMERPSREFSGAVEEIRLLNGVRISSVERLNGRIISEMQFIRGMPFIQRVDTDLDGRLETIRHFIQNSSGLITIPEIDYVEIDWDGNGVYERE
ncbi:MAG: hypothetical protein LBD07_03545 [Spirochaetaceae bacterium]|jgi:hypothetical protein|nr:hypothetical protein [Spirochaetaceae bacterium]